MTAEGAHRATDSAGPRILRIPVDAADWEPLLDTAAAAVADGDVVVLPTDTLYGVGCDAFNARAVAKVFAAKARSRSVPLPVMVHSDRQAVGLVEDIPDRARALMATYWPGPLTIVLKQAPGIGWDIGEGLGTVALRAPKQDFLLALLHRTGPLAVTSANRSGVPTPPTVAGIAEQLGGDVALYLDAGPATGGAASTIVDVTGNKARILREGAVPYYDVELVLEERVIVDR